MSFDCFRIKMLVTFVAMVYVGLRCHTYTHTNLFHRFYFSAANIGTYNLTSFLKFRCPNSLKSMDRGKFRTIFARIRTYLLHTFQRTKNEAAHHFHSHQLILSYLRTFCRNSLTGSVGAICQPFLAHQVQTLSLPDADAISFRFFSFIIIDIRNNFAAVNATIFGFG